MKNRPAKPRGRPRDDEHAARRREEILVAATRLFAQHGYPGMDVQLVADELGVGKGTIYRYFPTKRDLFLAAVDRGMRRLTERIDAVMHECGEPLEQIRAAAHAYLAFFNDNADLVELLIQERAEFRDRKVPTYFIYHDRNVGRWKSVMEALTAAGRIRAMPFEQVSQVLGDLMYGTMFTNYFTRRRIPPERQAEDINDIVFRGILSPQERGRLYGE